MTWGIWETYWPHHDDHTVGHRINVLPKYVPSTKLTESTWQNTHFISRDRSRLTDEMLVPRMAQLGMAAKVLDRRAS